MTSETTAPPETPAILENRPALVISGGQTGADLGGLRAARALGIPTSGWIPRGYKTEEGNRPQMGLYYHLREHASPLYGPRTRANVEWADVTILFGDLVSVGSQRTWREIQDLHKPCLKNPSLAQLRTHRWTGWVVNVAGNRERRNRGLEQFVFHLLRAAWGGGGLDPDLYTPRLRPPMSE